MDEERKDEIQNLYDRINKISNFGDILFLLTIIISFVLLFDFKHKDVFITLSIILTLGYIGLSNINDIYFSNLTEMERRKSLLKESFNINITLKETNKYYNNEEIPSIKKLGLNCYESAFFTKKVVDKMMFANIIKITIFILIYIVLMIQLKNLELLLVITQTLFSAKILFYFIKLCYYKFQLDKICKEFQDIFFIRGISSNMEVLLLDATMDYECLKSYCKIATSSKFFNKYNKVWSDEWNKVIKKLKKQEANWQK